LAVIHHFCQHFYSSIIHYFLDSLLFHREKWSYFVHAAAGDHALDLHRLHSITQLRDQAEASTSVKMISVPIVCAHAFQRQNITVENVTVNKMPVGLSAKTRNHFGENGTKIVGAQPPSIIGQFSKSSNNSSIM